MILLTRKRAALVNLATLITNIVTARPPGDYSHVENHLQKSGLLAEKVYFLDPAFLIERVTGQPSGHDIRDQRQKLSIGKLFLSVPDHF